MGCVISYPKCQEELCNNSIILNNLEDKAIALPNNTIYNPSPSKTFDKEDNNNNINNNYSSPILKNNINNNANNNNNNQLSNSNKNTNTKSIIGNDINDLSLIMFNEINKARESPWTYATKVSSLLSSIETVNGKKVLNYNDKVKIQLNRGNEAFNDCIQYLEAINRHLPPFVFKDELKITFPSDKPDKCVDPLYLNAVLSEKSINSREYTLVDFQYDLSPTAEFSTLFQIVDDTNSKLQRRKNIFSSTIKYIGINCGKINEDVYCFYLLFAK